MAKSKALVAAEAKIAALEARLEVATQVYRAMKVQLAHAEAQLNARGAQKVAPAPTVTQFTRRDGVVMEKVRIGNRAVIRPAAAH